MCRIIIIINTAWISCSLYAQFNRITWKYKIYTRARESERVRVFVFCVVQLNFKLILFLLLVHAFAFECVFLLFLARWHRQWRCKHFIIEYMLHYNIIHVPSFASQMFTLHCTLIQLRFFKIISYYDINKIYNSHLFLVDSGFCFKQKRNELEKKMWSKKQRQ